MIRRPSRARRIAKWGGLVVCMTVGAAWILSPWLWIGCSNGQTYIGLSAGAVGIGAFTRYPRNLPGVHIVRRDRPKFEFFFIPGWSTPGGRGFTVLVPLWIPLLLTAISTAILWRRDRIPPGHCQRCGYNLTGNVSGRCPECGEAV